MNSGCFYAPYVDLDLSISVPLEKPVQSKTEEWKEITWPKTPTCHVGARFADLKAAQWRDGDSGTRPYRTCYYCGSMHPEDMLNALKQGARLLATDWKYGWPHKFYIENIPNPEPDRLFELGGRTVDGVFTPHMQTLSSFRGKWYNDHFMDEGYSPDAFEMLVDKIKQYAGVEFFIREDKLYYKGSR